MTKKGVVLTVVATRELVEVVEATSLEEGLTFVEDG